MRWTCRVCSHRHEGEKPPDRCPTCGVESDKFVEEGESGGGPGSGARENPGPPGDDPGPPKNLDEVRTRARAKLKGVCAVYPRCDGDKSNVCQREAYGLPIGLGGIGSGLSFAANVEALARIRLRTRVVGRHFEPDTRISFLGCDLSMPIMVSSTGGLGGHQVITEDELATACVEGCRAAGTISLRGDTVSYTLQKNPALDAIQAAGGWGIPVFKPRAQDDLKRLIERAEAIGCPAVGVDLDGCGSSNFARAGKPVYRKSIDDMRELVGFTALPFIFKGIMEADDAEAAVEAGARVVSVSNHGGRVLDSTPGVAEVFPEIAERVGGRALLLADGGVRTGFDVLKFLALGATAVMIGRDAIRAAIGGGSAGVAMQMVRLGSVLKKAMLMTGRPDLSSIDDSILR
jgi:isopentenyl diphosphate isomerase/L-lactate dehydrogenase-like FMN-dependent dehydrogenase